MWQTYMGPIWAAPVVLEVPTTNFLITSLKMVRFWQTIFGLKALELSERFSRCTSARAPAKVLVHLLKRSCTCPRTIAFKQKFVYQNLTIIKEVIIQLVVGGLSSCLSCPSCNCPITKLSLIAWATLPNHSVNSAQALGQLSQSTKLRPSAGTTLPKCLGNSAWALNLTWAIWQLSPSTKLSLSARSTVPEHWANCPSTKLSTSTKLSQSAWAT